MLLHGKNILVTGAGSGVGRALAFRFAEAGARVILAGRRLDRLEDVRSEIVRVGGGAECRTLDVTLEADVISFCKWVDDQIGELHVLFNNAGSFRCIGGVWEVSPSEWWSDVTANLLGPLLMMRYAIPLMKQSGEGVVINMGGGGATMPLVGGSGYGSSKAALLRLTETAARELDRENIPVGVIGMGPGLVRTEMTELQISSKQGRRWIPSTADAFAAGKVRPAEDCANSAVELLKHYIPAFSGRLFQTGMDFASIKERLQRDPSSSFGLLRLS